MVQQTWQSALDILTSRRHWPSEQSEDSDEEQQGQSAQLLLRKLPQPVQTRHHAEPDDDGGENETAAAEPERKRQLQAVSGLREDAVHHQEQERARVAVLGSAQEPQGRLHGEPVDSVQRQERPDGRACPGRAGPEELADGERVEFRQLLLGFQNRGECQNHSRNPVIPKLIRKLTGDYRQQ